MLDDAAASARGFGSTVDSSTAALTTAATDLRAIVPQLRSIETQANAINILGSQPARAAGRPVRADRRPARRSRRPARRVATNLGTNRSALDANATSLAALATETRALADRLGGDALPGAIDDLRWLMVAILAVGDARRGRAGRRGLGGRLVAPPERAGGGTAGPRLAGAPSSSVASWPASVPRSNQIRSPRNRSVTGSHGKQDQDLERDRQAARRGAAPRPDVRAGQRRDLEDALRPDDDLGQREAVVRERPRTARCRRRARRRGRPSAGRSGSSRTRTRAPASRSGRRCRGGPRRSSGGPTAA